MPDTLFDLGEYVEPGKERKKPESQAEKEQRRLDDIDRREMKNLENRVNRGLSLTADQRQALKGYRERFGFVEGASLPEGVVRTMKEVAAHFGKHLQSIKNWAKKGMPRNPDSYDLKAIEDWAIAQGLVDKRKFDGDIPEPDPDDSTPDLNDLKRNNLKLDGKLKKLKLSIAKGEYVKKEDIAKEWAGRMAEVGKGLDYLSTRLPPLLEGKSQGEMRTIISNETWEIRNNYARTGRFCPEDPKSVA